MFQFDMALCLTQKVSWCLYALFVNNAERIKTNSNCEGKLQIHNVAYNLWAISALVTRKLQI